MNLEGEEDLGITERSIREREGEVVKTGRARASSQFFGEHMGNPTDKSAISEGGEQSCTREKRVVTWEEVQKHNTANDCWFVIDDNVYDATKFASIHPGGKILHRYAGMDATDVFYAFHGEEPGSPGITALPRYLVGKLEKPLSIPAHLKDFRDLRKTVSKEGLMNADRLWFLAVFMCYAIVYSSSIVMLYLLPHSWATTLASGIIMGICWGQGGLLQHDLAHNSVFFTGKANYIANWFFYTALMGGCQMWWRGRHTRHHASPNHSELDLDIRTLPLFAWDKKQFKKAPKVAKYQVWYWTFLGPPMMLILYRIINTLWLRTHGRKNEIYGAILHFVWLPATVWKAFEGNLFELFVWYVLILVAGGGYLGWVFALNHTMFPIYRAKDERDWLTGTVTTTQDVTGGAFVHFLTGHLSQQIEHHLWPRMPRHNYSKVAPRLEAICKKHNLPYYTADIFTAAKQVLNTLIEATKPETEAEKLANAK